MDGLTLLSLAIFIITGLWYITGYYSFKFSHWKRKGINGPKCFNPLGDLPNDAIIGMRLNDLTSWTKYGKVFGTYFTTTPILVVSEPELIKDILVTQFMHMSGSTLKFGHDIMKKMLVSLSGNEWKRLRSIISPTFTSGKMKAMLPLMDECHPSMEQAIDRAIDGPNKGVLEMRKLFDALTMDVIARCAFSTILNNQEADSEFAKHGRGAIHGASPINFLLSTYLPEWLSTFFQLSPLPKVHLDYLIDTCRAVVQNRKSHQEGLKDVKQRVDFITLLLESKDELTEDEILGSALVILFGGYETTATLLTFMSYCLALNPDVQKRLQEEVDALDEVCYDTIFKLEYMDAFMKETLRMYPPLVRFDRKAEADVTLCNGLAIEKGTVLRVPIYSIHHDPELWPKPEVFNPERFLSEKDSLIPYAWIPFVDGPRNCVGRRFAELEVKMVMSKLLRKYSFSRCEKTEKELKFTNVPLILAPESCTVRIQRR